MAIKAHPEFEEISRAIQRLSKEGSPFSAVCYRCTEPQFADQIISGLGSQIFGARWTPKHSFPTVYLSESVETALQEYLARGRRLKLPDHRSLPMVMAWVKVKAVNMLDMTAPDLSGVIAALLAKDKIHWRAIQDRREAVSQAIGRAIKDTGFSGLIAPSQAVPNGRNIVLFPHNLSPSDRLDAPTMKPISLK